MAILRTDWLHAAAVFRDLGNDEPTPVLNAGFDRFIRNGVGDYTLICNESISDAESQCNAWAGPNELLFCGAMVTEPGKLRVRCYDLIGVAADPITLNVEIKQLQTGPAGDGVLPPAPTPPAPPGPGITVNSSIIWRPSAPSSGNTFQTWAEIEPLIASTQGFLTIYLDAPGGVCTVPSIADTECFGRLTFQVYPPQTTVQPPTLQIDDGGRLRNPGQFSGILVKTAPTDQPSILGNLAAAEIVFRDGSLLSLEPGATVPAVQLLGTFQEVAFAFGSRLENNSGNPALSVIDVPTPGNVVIFGVLGELGNSGPPQMPSTAIQGPAGVTVVWVSDASCAVVAQTNFLGTLQALPADWALGVGYDDSALPPLGATNVQTALDALKAKTALTFVVWRPSLPSSGYFVQTWAEVEAAIAATAGFLTVYLDEPGGVNQVPATATTDCSRVQFAVFPGNLGATLEIADGGYIRNPLSFSGVTVWGAFTSQSGVVLDVDGQTCEFRNNSRLQVNGGGAVPTLAMQGNGQTLRFLDTSRMENASGGSARVVSCPTAGNVYFLDWLLRFRGNWPNNPDPIPADCIEGPAGATLAWVSDASAAAVPQPFFAGTVIENLIDQAAGVLYDDTLTAPPLGATNVQGAIDALKVLLTLGLPIANLRYVSPASGNDLTGTGSIAKPFATVTRAYTSITDAAPTKRYGILVTGRMTEAATITMKANVYVIGTNGPFSSRVQAFAWVLDASWTPAGDNRGGFLNCTVAGAVNVNWWNVTSNEGKFAFFGCWVNDPCNVVAFSLINQLIVENTRTFSAWSLEGSYSGRNNYWGGVVSFNESNNNGTRFQCESDNDHFESGLSLQCNNSTANVANLRAGSCAQLATARNPGGTGTITISATADFLSQTVNLGPGGFTSLTLLTMAKAIGFTPAGTANPSTEAQTAITVAGALPSFVYDPFAPSSSGNVYTSLLALLAAAALIPGTKNIEMRNAFPVLPVGTYDFTDCEVRGQTKGVTLQFPAGARIAAAAGPFLSGLPSKITDINFEFLGAGTDAGDFCTLPSNNEITLQLEDADLIASAGAAGGSMFKVSSTTQFSLSLLGSSKISIASAVAGWNMFRGPGGATLNVYMSCGIDGGVVTEDPSLLGDVISAVFSGIGQFNGVSHYTQTVGEVYYSRAAFYLDGGGLWQNRADARNITSKPAGLAADQNNYAPADLAACSVLYLKPTVANVNISGFESAIGRVQYGVAPQPRLVVNNGTGNASILNASGLSLPYNQVKTSTGATAVLAPNQMGILVYETTGNPATGFWRFAKLA